MAILRQRQEFSGRIDLARLARLLPATLCIRPSMQINAGEMNMALSSRPQQQGVVWHGKLDVANLTGVLGGKEGQRQIVWQSPLSAMLDAHDAPAGPIVDALQCKSDFLTVEAAGTPDEAVGTMAVNLQQLADRLGQFVDLGQLQFAGQGGGRLSWKRSPQGQFDAGGQLDVRGFQWAMAGQTPWREDSITAFASAKGQTDLDANTRIDAAAITVKAGADQFDAWLAQPVADLCKVVAWPFGVRLQGQLQGWPARLAAWLPSGNWRLAGGYLFDANGTASFQQSASAIHAKTTAQLTNVTFIDSLGRQLQEPRIQLAAAGGYDSKSGSLQIEQCQMSSSAVAAGAVGRLAPVGGQEVAQLDGQVNYDLQRLTDLLRPFLGPAIRVAGSGSSQAWYRGPFSLTAGSAATAVHWSGANLCGASLGPGELQAALAGGMVWVKPLDLAVSQGRIHLAPQLRLTPNPVVLSLPKGLLAERVQIDAEMCKSLLKYVAPALADVLDVHGTFSVELDRCTIPLSDPTHSDVAGRLIAHAVQIGKSPMTEELAILLSGRSGSTLRPDSVVSFRMENGRVYHEGLEMQFPELTIRTQGWVGLDQKLDVTASMSVPPKWLAGIPVISDALRKQVIRLPIKGTLDHPQLDRAEMARLSQQFIGKAAGNVIEGGLNQLFGPKK